LVSLDLGLLPTAIVAGTSRLREAGEVGAAVRALILDGDVSRVLRHAILKGHREAFDTHGLGTGVTDVARRVFLVAYLAKNAVKLVRSDLAQATTVN
jgi:hypothetical protein